MSYNKTIILGNICREPELRVTQGGHSICKFAVAVNRNFTDKSGEKREETCFVDVESFGKQADVIAKFFAKGKPILVEGRLKQDQFETKAGEKRSKMVVVLEQFSFVGGRNDESNAGSPSPASSREPVRQSENVTFVPGGEDDETDVPF